MAARGSNRRAVVVGAGIVGVCCALGLQRRGVSTILLDRGDPGEQCSFGNAARIASASCAPRSTPGYIWRVPAMLTAPWHPLKFDALHLLRALPWFWRFVRAGRSANLEPTADALFALLSRADSAFDELVAFAGATSLVSRSGFLYAYQDAKKLAAARAAVAYSTRRGMVFDELSGDEARELEPGLPKGICGAFHRPGEALVVDPLALTRRLVECFEALGGQVLRSAARRCQSTQQGVALHTDTGIYEAHNAVIATGAWTQQFAASMGVYLPIQAERGYHAEVSDPGIELSLPISLGDRHVSLSPLAGRLRIASGAEFAPVDAPPKWKRLERVLASARSYYPELRTAGHTRWMGGRPSTPDSVPVIGASAKAPNVLFASGHGMYGLTLAAVTGQLIGELAGGEAPAIDLAPYSPERF